MSRLRLGLVGTSQWARTVHGAAAKVHPNVDLVGVWGRHEHKTKDLADHLDCRAFDSYETLLAEIDAVAFSVPPNVQAPLALRAAMAGKH